jgi:hypothetical protein
MVVSVNVAPEVIIRKPRAEVAAFMFDPARDAQWTGGVVEVRPLTEGLLRTGSRVERVSRFMGKTFPYLVEVTDSAPESFVQMKVDKPFPMNIRYELEDVAEGTRARIRCSGEARGFFRIAGPLMNRMVKKSITEDLERLKACVETSVTR